jgi:hypothetical protein
MNVKDSIRLVVRIKKILKGRPPNLKRKYNSSENYPF